MCVCAYRTAHTHTHTPDATTFRRAPAGTPSLLHRNVSVSTEWILPSFAPQRTPKCMELLPCELVIARYNDCAHQDSGRLGRCAAVLGYVSCELLPLPRYNEDISWARGFTNCTRTTVYEKGEPLRIAWDSLRWLRVAGGFGLANPNPHPQPHPHLHPHPNPKLALTLTLAT